MCRWLCVGSVCRSGSCVQGGNAAGGDGGGVARAEHVVSVVWREEAGREEFLIVDN